MLTVFTVLAIATAVWLTNADEHLLNRYVGIIQASAAVFGAGGVLFAVWALIASPANSRQITPDETKPVPSGTPVMAEKPHHEIRLKVSSNEVIFSSTERISFYSDRSLSILIDLLERERARTQVAPEASASASIDATDHTIPDSGLGVSNYD